MTILSRIRASALAVCLGLATCSGLAHAADLGTEGTIYEPIEEDFRVMLMRLIARQDWTISQREMTESARDYTKNLPSYYLPRATKTQTRWKDVGVITTEDIYLPTVDWKTGSVFEPQRVLATKAGTYLNPIGKMPARAIERLFVFDATDPDQLSLAKTLMAMNVPQLSFMVIAGDVGKLSEEVQRPVYHSIPTMLEKFHLEAVPTLIGFGKGMHQGHMALTEFALPVDPKTIQDAWFGLPYSGYDPASITDEGTAPAAPLPVENTPTSPQAPAASEPSNSAPVGTAP